ncbi:MAG: GAF domain-containing protein, partial [Deltaproteobacteria bacterium]|nr:GAF domain-containing protein [Deltaproteobacteria bacterium]
MDQDIITLFKERILSLEESYVHKIAELSLLKELGDALKSTSLSQWDELFFKQLGIIKKHTGIRSVSIMLLDEATQLLYVVGASRMQDPSGDPPVKFKKDEGVAGKAFSTSKTLYIPDVTKNPMFLDKGTEQKGSLACAPIISEGRPIGVLNFRDNIPYSFGPNELRFFELIADQLSITASLVRTYQDLVNLEKKRINLSRYFSRGLAEHLLADERMTRLGGEKKLVTTVFIDIANFTPMVEGNPVEGVVSVLNSFFEAVVPIIFKHGGMLDKFLGDGIMAIFGIPDASDDDPVNAIQCTVDVQKAVHRMK